MANTGEVRKRSGAITNQAIAPGVRVRIDPQLRLANRTVLVPALVTVYATASGRVYLIDWVSVQPDGTFDWQNNTGETIQSFEWIAQALPSPFIEPQEDLGPLGANPSPLPPFSGGGGGVTFKYTLIGPLADRDGPGENNLSLAEVDATLVRIDSSASSQSANLPEATAAQSGCIVNIKRQGENPVTIDPFAGQTIDNESTYSIPTNNDSIQLVWDGSSNWIIS